MKNSFRDPTTNILKGWGFTQSNGDDLIREEPDDFNLEPGKWQLIGGDWVGYTGPTTPPYVPTTIDERIADIDRQRDEKIAEGFVWQGNRWHADPTFQTQMVGLVSAYNNSLIASGALTTIRTKTNVNVALRLDQIITLAGALIQYVQSVYAWSWTEKDKIT